VTLSDREITRLDELRGSAPRAIHLRRLLYEPPSRSGIVSHEEVLALLSEKARSGAVSAAIALERALRHEPDPTIDDELARILDGG
jgi:hypothetical protein